MSGERAGRTETGNIPGRERRERRRHVRVVSSHIPLDLRGDPFMELLRAMIIFWSEPGKTTPSSRHRWRYGGLVELLKGEGYG